MAQLSVDNHSPAVQCIAIALLKHPRSVAINQHSDNRCDAQAGWDTGRLQSVIGKDPIMHRCKWAFSVTEAQRTRNHVCHHPIIPSSTSTLYAEP